jgi:hypothetical protein
MRLARAFLLPVLAILIISCSSPAATTGDGDGNGSQESVAPEATVAGEDGGGGGGEGGGGGDADIEQIAEGLTPPNSSETSRTTAGGVIFVTYTSTDSPDTLKSFYENAISETGWPVISTTSAEGSHSWIFAESETSSNAGVVSVGPGTDGSGSTVAIQVGAGE